MRRPATAALLGSLVLVPTAASGQWPAGGAGTTAVAASTMTNASGFTASCSGGSVALSWTVSPDVFVEGYEILRTGSGGGASARIQLPRAQSTYVDTPAAARGQDVFSYTYTIRAGSTVHSWTTPTLPAAGTLTFTKNGCTKS